MGRNQAKKQATPQPAKVANATGNKRPLAPTSGKAIKRGKFDEHVQRSGRYEESDDEEVDEDDEEDEEEEEGDEDENGSEDDEEGDSEGDDDEDDEEEGSDDGFRPAEGYAVGIDAGTQYPGDIEALQSLMYESELNFICLDLNHAAPLLDQLSLDSGELNSVIMGKLDLPAVDASQWSSVEKNVFSQYAFAAHMGLQAVLIKIHPSIASDSWQLMQVCRMITNMLSKFPPTAPQLWLRIPMDQWQLWDAIRHGIDHHTHVFLALDAVEVTNGTKVFDAQEIRRWLAEPIKAVLLDSEHLLGSDTTAAAPTAPPKDKKTKGKGSTSAGTSRQAVTKFIPSEEMVGDFLRTFFDFKMHFIIVPAAAHKIPNNPESFMDSEALSVALQRLQFQFAMWRETPLAEDEDVAESLLLDQNFSFSFRDKLQTPLDPLHQNLDLETYRVMEEDPIKYQRYEMALIAATRDLKKTLGKAVTPTTPLRILVVGPGRGPLIASSLVASAVNQVPVEVIAIEKNPNAVRTLRHRFAQFITEPTTHNRVRVIEGDMRERVVPVPAAGAGASHEEDSTTATATIGVGSVHIIVSELLGSFADNEASPECLYAIEHALHPRHGIMIPQSYTSYLVPVSASSLWQQARTMFSHHGGKNQFQQQGLDYPYVVHLHSHATYGGAAQPVFQVRSTCVCCVLCCVCVVFLLIVGDDCCCVSLCIHRTRRTSTCRRPRRCFLLRRHRHRHRRHHRRHSRKSSPWATNRVRSLSSWIKRRRCTGWPAISIARCTRTSSSQRCPSRLAPCRRACSRGFRCISP